MAIADAFGRVRAWVAGLSRRARWLIGSLAVVALLAGGTLAGARPVSDWLIGMVYQNVVPPEGGEMAVTVTSYPSSARVASILGGRGEGLNCSIPRFSKLFFPRSVVRDRNATATDLFRQACVFHDLCYRHGLATYGYSQADCDQMLQEQAARICTNVGGEECQLNAKKVLAGVTNGGFDSYQSWRTSTYYEFDPSPASSEHMSVARVIDHPFRGDDPDAARDDPEQLLLTFDITRSNTMVACRNCKARRFSPRELHAAGLLAKAGSTAPTTVAQAGPAGGSSLPMTEFSAQSVKQALDDLVRPMYTQHRPVGLPADGIQSAPRVLTADNGEQFIVWINRKKPENTVSCVIIADGKNLLTHTRSKDIECVPRASDRMRFAAADMNASSPQPELVAASGDADKAKVGVVGTGLFMSSSLQICLSTDLRTSLPPGQRPKCFPLRSPAGEPVSSELGAFQNFPIIKGERHIYLSRRVFDRPEKQQVAGAGHAVVFDVGHQLVPPGNDAPREIALHNDRKFDIPDDYDPMLPLTKDDDLRLLSLRTSGGKLHLYEIDLDADQPAPTQITTLLGAKAEKTDLDASWARRPVLVMDQPAENGEPAKTQLVLSRSLVTTTQEQGDTQDSVRLEFLVLERQKSDRGAAALRQVRGLTCNVTYTLRGANPSRPCQRSSVQVGTKRPSPAQMLQGAQLLAGKLTTPEQTDLDLALPDACYGSRPIILQPLAVDAAVRERLQPLPNLTVTRENRPQPLREVQCGPLSDAARIAQAMADK